MEKIIDAVRGARDGIVRYVQTTMPKQALEALRRLRDGNARFHKHVEDGSGLLVNARQTLVRTQDPTAIILGCSDARVPAEIIFDQGLGELFVIRVAGNVVSPSQVGSVEFAAAAFGTQLVVVLGHSQCGAIGATIEELKHPNPAQSRSLMAIIDRVRPAVQPLFATELVNDPEALYRRAVRANVRAAANHLRHGSALLEQLIADRRLLVVGAEYSLETGKVEFFDGVPG